jgi:hypothetical protein
MRNMVMYAGGVSFLDTMLIYRFTQIHKFVDKKFGGGYRNMVTDAVGVSFLAFWILRREKNVVLTLIDLGHPRDFVLLMCPAIFANSSLRRSRIGQAWGQFLAQLAVSERRTRIPSTSQ